MMKTLQVLGIIFMVTGIVFSVVFGLMIMRSATTTQYFNSRVDGSLLSYAATDRLTLLLGAGVLLIGSFFSAVFGLGMVALGKTGLAADVLRERLEKKGE